MVDDFLSFVRENVQILALIITVALAFVGYVVSHLQSQDRQRAEARLGFVSAQLERLYGPLYSLVESNTASWNAFRQSFRPKGVLFDATNPFSEKERRIWAAWAENVFIPSNTRIRDVIERNAHLLVGGEMPECFRRMIAHAESSKIVLPALTEGDMTMLDGYDGWPDDFNTYVQKIFDAVAGEHSRLLGRSRGRGLTLRVKRAMEQAG